MNHFLPRYLESAAGPPIRAPKMAAIRSEATKTPFISASKTSLKSFLKLSSARTFETAPVLAVKTHGNHELTHALIVPKNKAT